MERRQFVKNMAFGGASLVSLSSAGWLEERTKLTILHTNDTHSQIDPFPINHPKYPGLGGIERRKKLIDRIRSEERNVLLLDAGDIFQGTPYFNIHGGELELKLMSQLGYDAATMGNHDFDGGIDGFDRVLKHANFPFLCANYNFDNTVLKGKTKPYQIFYKDHLKIGIFGLGVELDGLVSPALFKETRYSDPLQKAQEIATQLKKDEKCNLVICLSHLGYIPRLNKMCDTVLATETSNIDLILGGHTHTFMEKAEIHKNKIGQPVLINQVGFAGLVLGRIDFYFNKKGDINLYADSGIQPNYSIS
ncbi:MAG: metallophosphatase [Crocinitomix sp.]|nr:metallophosphatase [Crocinitomix sp.]